MILSHFGANLVTRPLVEVCLVLFKSCTPVQECLFPRALRTDTVCNTTQNHTPLLIIIISIRFHWLMLMIAVTSKNQSISGHALPVTLTYWVASTTVGVVCDRQRYMPLSSWVTLNTMRSPCDVSTYLGERAELEEIGMGLKSSVQLTDVDDDWQGEEQDSWTGMPCSATLIDGRSGPAHTYDWLFNVTCLTSLILIG